MILTPRLMKIADMISCSSVADIGTDHAKLPIYLIENNICSKVIASDIATGPVMACKGNVLSSGYASKIDIRQGDGLKTILPGEVDAAVLAGMGGDLISVILRSGDNICYQLKEIILQPMSHIPELRHFLKAESFKVIDEVLVKEKEKIYTVIKVVKGKNQYKNEIDFIVSPFFLKNKDPMLKIYIKRLIDKYSKEYTGLKNAVQLSDDALNRVKIIIDNLEKIYEVAKYY